MLTVGSLFSGIGGLDLGLERAGMKVIWQSEIDPYGCRVLKKHWPEVVNHGNIKEINWGDVVQPDIICGGYPCQPFSTAGKRNGTDDPRHLWPWVREAISELRPKYAILENVRGHVSLGLNVVLGEMASIGYDAEWQIVSAASVGAPHRRDRVIIVAYPNSGRQQKCQSQSQQTPGVSFSSERVFTRDRWLNALLANTAQQFSNGEPDYTRDSARPETLSESGDSGGTQDVANTDSSDTPNGRQREGVQSENTSWRNDGSGSGSDTWEVSMGSTRQDPGDVANPDNNGLSSAPFRRSTRTATNKQSPRQDNTTDIEGRSGISREVADTDARETSRRLGGVSTDTRQIREQRDYARGEESDAGRQWWAIEPDVGRVAHGVPARVDRLRGLGNAVVPQVAELIGRMVIDYDTNL